MNLLCVNENGNCQLLRRLPRFGEYSDLVSKLEKDGECCKIFEYLRSSLTGVTQFSVATQFGGSWVGTPLMPIYKAVKGNAITAAIILG